MPFAGFNTCLDPFDNAKVEALDTRWVALEFGIDKIEKRVRFLVIPKTILDFALCVPA